MQHQGRELTDVGVFSLAPLLPWQYCLLACVLGLLSWGNLPAPIAALLGLLLVSRELAALRLAGVVAFFCLGVAMAVVLAPQPMPQATTWMRQGVPVSMQGRVHSVEHRSEDSLRLILENVRIVAPDAGGEERPLQGRVLWTWYDPLETPAPGSDVRAWLRLRPMRGMANEAVWDYEGWWARKGVRYKTWSKGEDGSPQFSAAAGSLLWRWRQALRERVLRLLEPQQSQGRAVLFSLLLGERSLLTPETKGLFRDGGVAHSLALSGLHVGMVVFLGFLLARGVGYLRPHLYDRLPRQKLGALLGGLLALVYIWLGGWSPSLLRAGLMFFFWGALYLKGRENCLLDGLFMAVGVILLVSPEMVYDLRLQLSATAVAGIACLLEFERLWRRQQDTRGHETSAWFASLGRRFGWWLAMLLLVSLAAQLALLPLIAWNFGQVALSQWLNLIWLPALGFVTMPLGLAGLLASLLPWEGAARLLFDLAAWPVDGFIALLNWLKTQSLLPVLRALRGGWPGWLGYWGALLALVLLLRERLQKGRVPALPARLLVLVLFAVPLLALPALRASLQRLDQSVTLRMLDVGQGQSLLLELPQGRRLLLDGGGFPFGSFDIGDAIVAPALTAYRPPVLEFMALSHADSDHSLGLMTPLRQFRVQRFASTGRLSGEAGADLEALLQSKGLGQGEVWQAGDRIDLGQGVVLETLHPAPVFSGSNDNEHSLALRLAWQGRGLALMPGDLQKQGVGALLESGAPLEAEVLILPHHGGWSGLEGALLRASRPCLALASAGYMNRYDFPDSRTVDAAQRLGVPVLTTAEFGGLEVFWEDARAAPQLRTTRSGRVKGWPEAEGCRRN